ncbi:MAG: hypothetical protein ABIH92_05750 [Nanoarchaeota archaeon]
MALNISLLSMPWPVFLGALILIVAVVIVLTVMERLLHKKVVLKKEDEDTYYRRKLAAVKILHNEPVKFLTGLDDLAREFFEEEFQITGARYSDIMKKFKGGNNGVAIKFCEVMQETLYSGERLSPRKLNFLFERLEFLIKEKEKENVGERGAKSLPLQQEIIKTQVVSKGLGKMPVVEKKPVEVVEKPVVKMPIQQVLETPKKKVNKNVVRYLSEGIRRGFDVVSLKEKLLAGGFNEGDVNNAITYVESKMPAKREAIVIPQQPVQRQQVEARPLPWNVQVPENIKNPRGGKRILTKFFHPKNKEIETIKKEVEDKEEPPRAEIIEIVPYKEEKIEVKGKTYPKKEPKSYTYIGSLDSLDRVKEKIKKRRESMVVEGHKGAGLGGN